MRIQNNISALNAHRYYTTNSTGMSKSIAKLSSGYRINSAADDPAGLAISEKMRAQIRGLNMASKNTQDAISLIQTAEGGLQNINDMVQKVRDLVNYASNDTQEHNAFMTGDRQKIQDEINQLTQEIDSMAGRVEFNKKKLLDGSQAGIAEGAARLTANLDNARNELKTNQSNYSIALKKLQDAQTGAQNSRDAFISQVTDPNVKDWLKKISDITAAASTGVDNVMTKINDLVTKFETAKTVTEIKDLDTEVNAVVNAVGDLLEVGSFSVLQSGTSGTPTMYGTRSAYTYTVGTSEYTKAQYDELVAGAASGIKNAQDALTAALGQLAGALGSQAAAATGLAAATSLRNQFTSAMSALTTLLSAAATTNGLNSTMTITAGEVAAISQINAIASQLGLGEVFSSVFTGMTAGDPFSNDNTDEIAGTVASALTVALSGLVQANVDVASANLAAANANVSTVSANISAAQSALNSAVALQSDLLGATLATSNTITEEYVVSSATQGTPTVYSPSVIPVEGNMLGEALEGLRRLIGPAPVDAQGSSSNMVVAFDALKRNYEQFNDADKNAALALGEVQDSQARVAAAQVAQNAAPKTGGLHFQVGANANQSFNLYINSVGTDKLGIGDGKGTSLINVLNDTGSDITSNLNTIDFALSYVSTERSKLGVAQNRLTYTMDSLDVSAENLTASESRIRDVDMAKEMSNFTRQNILFQASTAMLAQANSMPQGVLQLLG